MLVVATQDVLGNGMSRLHRTYIRAVLTPAAICIDVGFASIITGQHEVVSYLPEPHEIDNVEGAEDESVLS